MHTPTLGSPVRVPALLGRKGRPGQGGPPCGPPRRAPQQGPRPLPSVKALRPAPDTDGGMAHHRPKQGAEPPTGKRLHGRGPPGIARQGGRHDRGSRLWGSARTAGAAAAAPAVASVPLPQTIRHPPPPIGRRSPPAPSPHPPCPREALESPNGAHRCGWTRNTGTPGWPGAGKATQGANRRPWFRCLMKGVGRVGGVGSGCGSR